MESDWRKFRDLVPKLRERYLAERNARIVAVLTDLKKNETERFWDAMEQMEKEARVLQGCLDGHSRSSMQMYILRMIGAGMQRKGTWKFSVRNFASKFLLLLRETEVETIPPIYSLHSPRYARNGWVERDLGPRVALADSGNRWAE